MMKAEPQCWIINSHNKRKLQALNDSNVERIFSQEIENRMIEHMNEDHVQAMVDYCRYADIPISDNSGQPKMTAIGKDGFMLTAGKNKIKFEFDQPCETPSEAREALVGLAKKARST